MVPIVGGMPLPAVHALFGSSRTVRTPTSGDKLVPVSVTVGMSPSVADRGEKLVADAALVTAVTGLRKQRATEVEQPTSCRN